jgi:phosphate transport system substrate-binding protein
MEVLLKLKSTLIAASAAAVALMTVAAAPADAQQARDQIRIVGSSTVFPFTTAVAEQFQRTGGFKAPIVESTGTGGGMRLFCGGVGVQHPDVTNASRRMTKSEFEQCKTNGVTDIVEVKIGFDGIVLATKKGADKMNLTLRHVFLALARQVPVNGQLVNNPYTRWNQIDASLPALDIEVIGPPPTSGTRDSFNELAMLAGCAMVDEMKTLIADNAARARACQAIREDGKFIEGGENDNLIVQRLTTGRPGTMGIFGFSFLEENPDKIEGKTIAGVEPNPDTIAEGKYPIARDMYIYVKRAHVGVIPGIREFVTEYTSARAMGDNGYLEKKGLVVLPAAEAAKVRASATALQPLTM